MSTLKVNTIRHTGASSDAVTLASDGTCTAKITNYPHRNLVINGGFDIWQRATDSGSNTTDGYLAADRWYLGSSGATKQVTRQAFTLGQTDVSGYPTYYLRYAVTTGNNNCALRQYIEDVRKVQGEVTLSFWAKGTNPNGGNFDLIQRQDFGTGGSPSSVVDTSIGTLTVTGSWVRYTYTFTPPSIASKTFGTDNNSTYKLEIFRQPDGDTSTNAYTIDIANVQLEYGNSATDFERLSYGDELLRCQRYYQEISRTSSANTVNGTFAAGTGNDNGSSGGILQVMVRFPTTMRGVPTMTQSGTFSHHLSGINVADTTVVFTQAYIDGVKCTGTQTAFVHTDGFCGELTSKYSDASTAVIKASAEL